MAADDLAAWSDCVDTLRRVPGMWLPGNAYETMCGFLIGFDYARKDGVLDAFTSWLADRQVDYKNFAFEPMVRAEAGLGVLGVSERSPLTPAEHEHARSTLLRLLSEFLATRAPDV